MTRTPLAEYLNRPGISQDRLAKQVKLTQGGISKMLRTGRVIDVIENDDGTIVLEEKRLIASTSNAA